MLEEQLEKHLVFDDETIEAGNLTDRFSETDLRRIGGAVWEGFVRDKQTRREWELRNDAGMNLAMQIQDSKNFPWPNCSNVVFPLVSIASLQFWTRTSSNLVRGPQIVHYKSYGEDGKRTPEATILGEHASWQVLEEDTAWKEQHDRLWINTGIVGTAFIKTRESALTNCPVSELVMARDLVMDAAAKSVDSCRRKTQIIKIYRNEIWERCRGEEPIYRDVQKEDWYNQPARVKVTEQVSEEQHEVRTGIKAYPSGDRSTPYTCLEQHCWFDFDGDGYEEPYRILIESASHAVLRIVARVQFKEDVQRDARGEILSIKAEEDYTKYGLIPAPDGGIYDLGLGVLLGPLNDTVNTAINQIFDAGTMNLLGGGFAMSGGKLKAGTYTRTPGEFKILKGAVDDVRKAFVSWPEIPINDVLFKLLSLVIQYADRLAGTTASTVGENPGQNTPAQTYQGLVEQGTQIYRSILSRLWDGMKEEFVKRHRLNAKYLISSQQFGAGNKRVTREMYKTDPKKLAPIADPNMISDQQRINRATQVLQASHSMPGFNLEESTKDWLSAIGVEDPDRVYPGAYSEWYQQHPLPNPKVQAEQAKNQREQMKLSLDKWKFTQDLLLQQKKLTADIDLVRAQAAQIVAQIGADKAAHQLEVFDTLMTHLGEMAKAMNERIAAQMSGEGDESGTEAGGAGRDQSPSGGQAAVGLAAPAGQQPAGPVAGGAVQQ